LPNECIGLIEATTLISAFAEKFMANAKNKVIVSFKNLFIIVL